MTNPINASGTPGSANTVPAIDPNNPGGAAAGQTGIPQGGAAEVVPKSEYDQLFARLGAQGNELGQYKSFFESVTPLFNKLDNEPELVQAIVDGVITGELAKAVLAGKVQIGDANAVAQAAAIVQGNPDNQGKSASDVEKLIEEKAQALRKEFEEKSELQNFERNTQKFIESTPDFADHAAEIAKWLDAHDSVNDVQIAYWAVKGQMSEAAAKKAAESASGERARDIVANAAGGSSPASFNQGSQNIVDQLIGGRPDPNRLW